MATYEEAVTALRKADAAGETEDAKRLAALAQRLKVEAGQPSVRQSPGADLLRSAITGGANVLGAPVDIASAILRMTNTGLGEGEQIGGSENLRNLLSKVDLAFPAGQEPEGFGNRVARELGSTALPAIGVMGRGAQLARRGVQDATGVIDRIALQAAKNPAKTAAFEAASATAAATGGQTAEQYTDNPALIALGELAGGLAPSAVLGTPRAALAAGEKFPVVGAAIRGVQGAALPFTEAGGRVVAGRRIQELVEDPTRAAARLAGEETLPGVKLSPARSIGESRLLALERSILDEDPTLDMRFSKELAEANRATRAAAVEFQGDPKRARKLLEGRREHLLSLVDTKAAQTARKAEEAVRRLGPDATERQIAITVRGHVEDALRAARATERELWSAIDRDIPVDVDATRQTLAGILANRTKAADPDDIPEYVKKLLAGPESAPVGGLLDSSGRPITTKGDPRKTVGYITDLRSRLLDDAAAARKAGQRNKARILSELASGRKLDDGTIVANGLLQDLEKTGDLAKNASSFSNHLNDRFTRGSVGKMLGHEADRGLRVDPSETLEFIDAGKDIGRANQLTELMEASPDARPAVEQYLRLAFTRQATDGGQINPTAAAQYLRKYNESLALFPELRTEISGAIAASEAAGRAAGRQSRVAKALGNQRQSRAALYLDGRVGEEWRRVLNADDPATAAKDLLRQVRADPEAVQGMKQGFVEELLRRSQTGEVDEAGEFITSGKRFRKMLVENAKTADAILTAPERGRLRRVAATFERIEAKPGKPLPILDDRISNAIDFVASYLGAKAGGRLAKDMGASLVLAGKGASYYRQFAAKLTTSKARSLVTGAVDDPELYRALLVGPTDSAKAQKEALQRINAWLAVPASPGPDNTEQENRLGN